MESDTVLLPNGTERYLPEGPLLDVDDDPLDIFPDIPRTSSPLMQIPNFIQAILTLIISGLLLAACLILIRKCKQCCTSRKGYYDEENQGEQMVVSDTETVEGTLAATGPGNRSPYTRQESHLSAYSSRSSSRNSQRSVKVAILRRQSGPFGDEALAHAVETYRRPNKDYEDKISWARRVSTRRGHPSATLSAVNTRQPVVQEAEKSSSNKPPNSSVSVSQEG